MTDIFLGLRVTELTVDDVYLRRPLKIKTVGKKNQNQKVEDLASFENERFQSHQFSQIQKYLNCFRKEPSIPPTVKLKKRDASEKTDKANIFNTYLFGVFQLK